MRRALVRWAALLLALPLACVAADGAWPGDSLYRIPLRLTAADGQALDFAALAGRPLLVTMFYADCTSACPLQVEALRTLEGKLSPIERGRLRIAMVSFDPERDTPERIAHFAAMHRVEPGRWTLARGDAEGVRLLAAALGIRYRKLADGSYNHASLITLLDAQGVPRAQAPGLGQPDAAFLAALHAQLTPRRTP